MKNFLLAVALTFSVFTLNAQENEGSSAIPESVEENRSNSDSFEIIVSDKNTIDLSEVYGPYSFSSLPKDVRDKLINGLDENGNETVTQMLRRSSEVVGNTPNNRSGLDISASASSVGDRAVQLVRRVRGQSDGWSVRLRNRTIDAGGGQKIKSREFWIYYRNKFN